MVHFIPTLPLLILYLTYLNLPGTDRLLMIDRFYNGLSFLGRGISLNVLVFSFYAVLIGKMIIRVFHRENPMHRRLIRLFILLFSWVILLSARVISMYKGIGLLWRTVDVLICLELLAFYFHLQRYPVLMSFAHIGKTDRKSSGSSILDCVDEDNLKRKIEIMMEEDNLFCDEDLNLSRFSHALEIRCSSTFRIFKRGIRYEFQCLYKQLSHRLFPQSYGFRS